MLPIFNEIWREGNRREINQVFRRRRRDLREEFNLQNIPDERFIELFRINKIIFELLCHRLTPHLREPRYRSGVSIQQKILVALRFYATGSYQRGVGEDFNLGISQTCVHRFIHEVTDAIYNNLTDEYIRFPVTLIEQNEIKQHFMDKFNFPSCIGAVDGTHIAILKPRIDEQNFLNRKHFHSTNVQIICDADLRIRAIHSNYGGATHDAFIWRFSAVKQYLHEEYVRGMRHTCLIGDSGYPLEPYLMVPFLNPADNSPESRYNYAHIRARNCIERCIGVLKTRFRCLLRERSCRYSPVFVGKLVNVCAVLHNLCVNFNVAVDERFHLPEEDAPNNNANVQNNNNNLHNLGEITRNNIVNRYFNAL